MILRYKICVIFFMLILLINWNCDRFLKELFRNKIFNFVNDVILIYWYIIFFVCFFEC